MLKATSVLGGVRKRIASVSVHTLNIPEEHLAADVVFFKRKNDIKFCS